MANKTKRATSLDLPALLDSWLLHLRAERKSPETIRSYERGVRAYLDWTANAQCAADLDRTSLAGFTADLIDAGAAPATARSRNLSVRLFSAWLASEGEIPTDLLLGVRSPKLDNPVVPSLADDELRALIRACKGANFRDRRDEAIVRLMAETGARAGEVIAMSVEDVNLIRGSVIVRRGKGGKGRTLPIGPQAARSLDRYQRMRRVHPLAATRALWLGERGRTYSYHALYRALTRRAELAGLGHFHPHQLRHTAATRWLAAGGSEGGLLALAGWTRRDMLDRYTRSTSEARAAEEARRLGLGDL